MPIATTRIHTHAAASTAEEPYFGPVTVPAYQHPPAHGGICRTERCECGAFRKVNVNGRHREIGGWS
jgi:hypothetical protein